MNQHIAAILLAASALSACQATAPAPQQAALVHENLTQLKADRDARRISYTEWAERTRAAARASVTLNAEQEAAMEYRTQLARRVDAGEITRAQFDRESARMLQQLQAKRTGA